MWNFRTRTSSSSAILIRLEMISIVTRFRTKCEEVLGRNLGEGRTVVFLNTHGKNESEVPKELVTFLKYVKEDLAGSKKNFMTHMWRDCRNLFMRLS